MNRLIVSGDGDDVGALVGSAVLHDDIQQVKEISDKIEAGGRFADQWAKANGGQKISNGGDEFSYMFEGPAVGRITMDHIEELRQKYQEIVGHSLSVGLGFTASQSGKALMAAKLQGKDQALVYSPEIEDLLREAHEKAFHGQGSDEDHKINDHYLDSLFEDGDQPMHGENGDEEHFEESQDSPSNIESEDFGVDAPDGSTPEYYEDDSENPQSQQLVDQIASPESQDEIYDGGEAAPHTQALDMQGDERSEDVGIPGADEGMIAHGGEPSVSDEGQSDPQEHEMLNDMMSEEQHQAPDELKGQIAQVLAAFKDQKQTLDQIGEQAPEFKQATLDLLRVMIQMARALFPGDGESKEEQAPEQMPQDAAPAPQGAPQPAMPDEESQPPKP